MEEKKVEKKYKFPFTDAGDPKTNVYKRVTNKDTGRDELKVVDTFDIEERIQASSNLSDIAILKDRYRQLGEIPDLPQTGISGIDTSKIPTDIHQLHKIINGAGEGFDKLPADLQAAYGSKQAYINAIIDGSVYSVIGKYVKSKVKKDDVKKDEGGAE